MTENHTSHVATPSPRYFDRSMLEILVCPLTKEPLFYNEEQQELISKKAALAYPIRDGVPIMLIDEARKVEK